MITARISGIGALVSKRIRQLQSISKPADQDKITRIVALDTLARVHRRIHTEGKSTDGSQIGTYSKGYMTVRTGSFKNNIATKGKSKGEARVGKAGVFTKGKNKGEQRPKYNRTPDTKAVISLTKKLELSYAVIGTANGYGIGFIDQSVSVPNDPNVNISSWDKAGFVENTYDKKIFSLTKDEINNAFKIVEYETKKRLSV